MSDKNTTPDAGAEPVAWDREAVARIVFDAMRLCVANAPAWVEGGNSINQDRARSAADKIIATHPTPPRASAAASGEDDETPHRCGAFNAATLEQCILESDHAWSHIMPSDLVTHPEKPVAASGEQGAVEETTVNRAKQWEERIRKLARDVLTDNPRAARVVTEAMVDKFLDHARSRCVCVPPRSIVFSALTAALAVKEGRTDGE